ncbi:zinc finger MYM-type protein 1-like protein [Tanacetum coccineum]
MKKIKDLVSFFKTYRETGFSKALKNAKEIAIELNIDLVFVQKREIIRKRHFDESKNDALSSVPQSFDEYFKTNYFLCVVDQTIVSLNSRFEQYQEYEKTFGFLFTSKKLRSLEDNDLKSCCLRLEATLKHDENIINYSVTVTSAERSVSKLKLIKTYLRSTMSQERLNGLFVISIEQDMLKKIDYKYLIENFASKMLGEWLCLPNKFEPWYDLILDVVAAAAVESGGVKSLEMHNKKERIAGFSMLLGETNLYMWFSGKSSDIILVELENRMVKEDDRADLLEDGVLQAASPASHSSSITSPIGSRCGVGIKRQQVGTFKLDVGPKWGEGKPVILFSGWIGIGKMKQETSKLMIVQLQGNIKQSIFSCKFSQDRRLFAKDIHQKEQFQYHPHKSLVQCMMYAWSGVGYSRSMRELLSNMILGANDGWQSVSLTEIITTTAIRKPYKKASLCVHPDKLQQRGASI